MIKSRRMKWAGHVARMGEKINAYRILVKKPDGKSKMDLREVRWDGVDWIYLAQDRDQWRAVVNTALVYRDGGNLVSGSLDALVQHMVPTAEYYPDRAYLFAFLLSSRLFIKPHELLGEVCALCDSQQKLGDKQVSAKERLGRFVPHLVQLLAEWTETFPYDFRDERVMAHVRAITQKCVTVDPGIRKEVSTLLQNLLHRLTALEKYEEFLQRINAEASTNSVENLSPWSEFLASDPEVRVRFPALQDFLRSSGSGTGSTQPHDDNCGAISRK
ncbi:hypothetical protein B7P43_G06146 [Cryptotermes secundus]|uniref:N-terminal Ras-GEF domain-containing protein n=1 Tax=Cryptotermes secundus TaxID=105785 RepID=A0A2J7QQ77_9NEOP|nr:hypothetical protein B7P43_G06146 [Cryptotermes secundus]